MLPGKPDAEAESFGINKTGSSVLAEREHPERKREKITRTEKFFIA